MYLYIGDCILRASEVLSAQEAAASAKEEDKDNKRRRITDESHLPKAHEAKPVVGDGNKRKERDSIMPQPAKAANKASSKVRVHCWGAVELR